MFWTKRYCTLVRKELGQTSFSVEDKSGNHREERTNASDGATATTGRFGRSQRFWLLQRYIALLVVAIANRQKKQR